MKEGCLDTIIENNDISMQNDPESGGAILLSGLLAAAHSAQRTICPAAKCADGDKKNMFRGYMSEVGRSVAAFENALQNTCRGIPI